MPILICGSLAFDTIMVFEGRFRDHILADQLHILNVAFLVPSLRREFGGTAGNIAYNLKMLEGEPLIMATVGDDAGPYLERLEQLGLDARYVLGVPGTYTAQAFITTDLEGNQITAFHPGAMNEAHQNHVSGAQGVKLGILAPDGRQAMHLHAQEFQAAGIPFVFDPGQGLPMFDGSELAAFIEAAQVIAVNDYEAKLLCERTGQSLESIAGRQKTLVVTLGAQGSHIYQKGRRLEIAPVKPRRVADPTGCGDAYRAGLVYGISHDMDWETTGRLASTLGALKIAEKGPQNHVHSREEIAETFQAAYGYRPWS
ncbi:MAG: carbohydrate kinase family protein [Burkholderiaceae bacterium]|jgi:adenosine kinase